MPGGGRTVYVAGAGIAGLTLALALAKFGATVVVLERNKAIQEVGAGLQISPNARRVLNQLGLDRQIAAKAFEPSGIDVFPFRARRPLTTLVLGKAMVERYDAPYVVMHRADLADVLYRACKRFANIEIAFGVRAFDAESHARGVSVTADEADGKSRSSRAFAFVGADGVNSATRVSLLGGPQSTYSGYVAWRTTIPMASLQGGVAPDRTTSARSAVRKDGRPETRARLSSTLVFPCPFAPTRRFSRGWKPRRDGVRLRKASTDRVPISTCRCAPPQTRMGMTT